VESEKREPFRPDVERQTRDPSIVSEPGQQTSRLKKSDDADWRERTEKTRIPPWHRTCSSQHAAGPVVLALMLPIMAAGWHTPQRGASGVRRAAITRVCESADHATGTTSRDIASISNEPPAHRLRRVESAETQCPGQCRSGLAASTM
jgi:hypothetical protein